MKKEDQATSSVRNILSLFRYERTNDLTVTDTMSTPAVTRSKETTIRDIASIMIDKMINRIPIVDNDGLLLGIVPAQI